MPVRLTGQDAVRGTFSQRHLTFYDAAPARRSRRWPRCHGAASFDVGNSPLSETAALGFEYGYSVQAPDTLVLWEAQYGDFINGAQVIIDEFVASGQAKWGLVSGLVLLLPHAWEGQGPDHSSGRLERFLELAAEDNIRVANLHDGRPVLPPAAPPGRDARRRAAPADRDDAQEPCCATRWPAPQRARPGRWHASSRSSTTRARRATLAVSAGGAVQRQGLDGRRVGSAA